MKLSREHILSEASATGFRPEILEKVIQLLSLLRAINSHPRLKGKLALKGGTALNLFILGLPRLSVDIDLNYIGAVDREEMEADRPVILQAITAVCGREGCNLIKAPHDHAGGKFQLRYQSTVTQSGLLQLDLNFMYRVPLWPVKVSDTYKIGSHSASGIPVMDLHEIAAGKLAALLSRHAARDLYDVHRLLGCDLLEADTLRLAFTIYGAINRKDWRTVSADSIGYEPNELESQLIPVLSSEALSKIGSYSSWAKQLVDECKSALGVVLPLRANEMEFLNLLLEDGVIRPDLLTDNVDLQQRMANHPGLLWKALNVKQHKAGQ